MQSNTCIAYYEIFCETSFFSLQIYPKTLFQKNLNTASIPRNERKPVALLFFVEIKRLFVNFVKLLNVSLKTSLFLIHVKSVFFIMIASEPKTLY